MLQQLQAIGSLPHRYMWVKRRVPVVPVWSNAKLPRSSFSPEENCRLLSIYFRPWTLDPNTATADNPLLAEMRNISSCGSSNPGENISNAREPLFLGRQKSKMYCVV